MFSPLAPSCLFLFPSCFLICSSPSLPHLASSLLSPHLFPVMSLVSVYLVSSTSRLPEVRLRGLSPCLSSSHSRVPRQVQRLHLGRRPSRVPCQVQSLLLSRRPGQDPGGFPSQWSAHQWVLAHAFVSSGFQPAPTPSQPASRGFQPVPTPSPSLLASSEFQVTPSLLASSGSQSSPPPSRLHLDSELVFLGTSGSCPLRGLLS